MWRNFPLDNIWIHFTFWILLHFIHDDHQIHDHHHPFEFHSIHFISFHKNKLMLMLSLCCVILVLESRPKFSKFPIPIPNGVSKIRKKLRISQFLGEFLSFQKFKVFDLGNCNWNLEWEMGIKSGNLEWELGIRCGNLGGNIFFRHEPWELR